MKIGIANNLWISNGRGSGAEVVAYKMAKELKEEGHDIFIISTKLKEEKPKKDPEFRHYYINSSYNKLGNWPKFRKLIWHFKQLLFPGNKRQLRKILETEQPQLFISHNLLGLGKNLNLILKKLAIRHEHVLHDVQLLHPSGLVYYGEEKILHSLAAKIYQHLTRKIISSASLIISPSKWLLAIHQDFNFFKNQESLIKRNFNLEKQKKKEFSSPLRFIFTGQIEKHKGIDLLLSAWNLSKLSANEARLYIAGNGSLAEKLKGEIKTVDNISYLGWLNRKELKEALLNSDILILPSLVYENSPTSLWEAAQLGLSAIASNLGGIPELAPYLNLELFKPGDVQALSDFLVLNSKKALLKK